jgi:hypothetical protein
MAEALLTENEVSETLNVPLSTLRYWRQCGDGPEYYKLGDGKRGTVRYAATVVEAWLNTRLRVPNARARAEASFGSL